MGPASALDVVRRQGAVQAQDYPNALWALSQRTSTRASAAAIEADLDAGRILRTHVLRPTWHFVASEDIRWMLALTGPRIRQQMASYNRKFGLTPAVFARSFAILERALSASKAATRAALRAALEQGGVAIGEPQRLGHLMMEAELAALICSGPRQGRQFTYALLADRVRVPSRVLDRDEALAELARRYFATRSPATVHDFSWWSGLTVADARRGIEVAGHLCSWDVSGTQYWLDESCALPRPRRTAHLLPNYDEYFIGYRDRRAIGTRVPDIAAVTGGSMLISHVAFIDGDLVAGWRRSLEGDTTVITLKPLTRLTHAERARLHRVGERFAAFLDQPVALRWT